MLRKVDDCDLCLKPLPTRGWANGDGLVAWYADCHPPADGSAPNRYPQQGMSVRPPTSVIVPFLGTERELVELADRLAGIRLKPDDEALIVWNAPADPPSVGVPDPVRIVTGSREQSSYHARNLGACAARNDWLLFIDGDCNPTPNILDAYFPDGDGWPANVAVVAGGIASVSGDSILERYASSRGYLDQGRPLRLRPFGYGQTANLLVRRASWREVRGFAEGIVSAGDADFCWRVQIAGGTLEYQPEAQVTHVHRRTLRSLWQQWQKYGRGRRWLNERHPTFAVPVPPLRHVVSPLVHALDACVRRREWEEAAFLALDGVCTAGLLFGYRKSNVAPCFNTAKLDDAQAIVE